MRDSDGDGLADTWASYHGVAGAGGNPDGDPFTNAQEFDRGSDPRMPDSFFRRYNEVRVVGNFTGWAPESSPGMTLQWDNTWVAYIFLGAGAGGEFKFVGGSTWADDSWGEGGSDAIVPSEGEGVYRFTVNDSSRSFSVDRFTNTFRDRYPGFRVDQAIRGRSALMDYLHGGTAAAGPDEANLPAVSTAAGVARVSFGARSDDPLLRWRVSSCTNLAAGVWSTNGITALPTESAGGGTIRCNYEMPGAGTRCFFRLEAETN